MAIYIGADHRGFQLKEILKNYLRDKETEVVDMGNENYDENDDYVDFAKLVAEKVAEGPDKNRGILICRSGVGVSIVANKFKGIRCGLIHNVDQAYLAKNDDDINILAFSAEFTNEEDAKNIIDMWLKTPFSGKEKDERRIEKIKEVEKNKE